MNQNTFFPEVCIGSTETEQNTKFVDAALVERTGILAVHVAYKYAFQIRTAYDAEVRWPLKLSPPGKFA
jgi:hypothetical protein